MRLIKLALICLAVCLASCLTGCATGVKYQDMKSSIATLNPDQGRIYFVRKDTMVGAAIQPNIFLDNVNVGESKPGGFFYIDTNPGNHLVSTTTEIENKLTFVLDAGETKYVRTSISLGLFVGHVTPQLVSVDDAMTDLQEAKYIGKNAIAKSPNQTKVADSGTPAPQPAIVETIPVNGNDTYSNPAATQPVYVESTPTTAPAPDRSVTPSAQHQQAVEPLVVRNVSYTTPQMNPHAKADPLDNVAVITDNGKVAFKLGVSSNTVEKMGKQRGCESKQGAGIISTNGPAEMYMMSCNDGSTYLAKCELRQCAPM
jgi:hypothetical protein